MYIHTIEYIQILKCYHTSTLDNVSVSCQRPPWHRTSVLNKGHVTFASNDDWTGFHKRALSCLTKPAIYCLSYREFHFNTSACKCLIVNKTFKTGKLVFNTNINLSELPQSLEWPPWSPFWCLALDPKLPTMQWNWSPNRWRLLGEVRVLQYVLEKLNNYTETITTCISGELGKHCFFTR